MPLTSILLSPWLLSALGPSNVTIKVPGAQSTVLGAVADQFFPGDALFYGQNIYADNPLLGAALYNETWAYDSSFSTVDAKRTVMTIQGLNYRGNLFVNGHLVADNNTIVGPFREFTFDVTPYVTTGDANNQNSVRVEVQRQFDRSLPASNHDVDLGMTFVDWAPQPVDGNMGLWRAVEVRGIDGDVMVSAPYVDIVLPGDGGGPNGAPGSLTEGPSNPPSVTVTFGLQVRNFDLANPVKGALQGFLSDADGNNVLNISSADKVTLDPGADVLVVTGSYVLESPQLWWPRQMGNPYLYSLTLGFYAYENGQPASSPSDQVTTKVGLRTVSNPINADGYAFVLVQGWPLLVRGGGWSPDLFLRYNNTGGSSIRMATELGLFVTDMGLNAVRLEGRMEQDEFYQLCDQLGIMALPGWSCCDAWQHWPYWGPEQYLVANESMRTQARRLRGHPSVVGFFISSDELPPANVEANYRAILQQEAWKAGVFAAAAVGNSTLSGTTGVKMSGPYSWVPPDYFHLDKSGPQHPSGNGGLGGGWGFLTEGGPGEAPMTVASLALTLPESEWWPPSTTTTTTASSNVTSPDFCWGHCGNPQGLFGSLKRFNIPLVARYGVKGIANSTITLPSGALSSSTSDNAYLQQYLFLSQMAVYESHRSFFEAYTKNKFTYAHWVNNNKATTSPGTATGLIQWMLNSPWPSNIWHLYDYNYLLAGTNNAQASLGAGYYAVKKACGNTVALVYAYDDAGVWVINNAFKPYYAPTSDNDADAASAVVVAVAAYVYALNGSVLHSQEVPLQPSGTSGILLPPDSSTYALTLPTQEAVRATLGSHQTYLVRLQLTEGADKEVLSQNDYWLSTDEDVLEWGKSTFYNTPCSSYGDYGTALWSMPLVDHLDVTVAPASAPARTSSAEQVVVTISNPSPHVAFFVSVSLNATMRLRLPAIEGEDPDPVVTWSDTYLPFLLPGEVRNLTATLHNVAAIAARDENDNSEGSGGSATSLPSTSRQPETRRLQSSSSPSSSSAESASGLQPLAMALDPAAISIDFWNQADAAWWALK